jgi:hypothetical protein
MENMKSVPMIKWDKIGLSDENGERVYRVPRGLSDSGSSLYEMVLERSEMSQAEAQMIVTEHRLLFSSIWRYWLYADSRLNILASMRYSSFLSWIVFIICVLPLWIWRWLVEWELWEWVDWRLQNRMIKKIKI